mgnify:CR=1 FL=1
MTQIKLRRDTAANFTSKNPVLGIGEPAYETDTKKLKIGDGTTAYNNLDYFAGGGGSTEFNVVQPLKLVHGTLTLQIDEQTIQVQDGKLVANLDELGNEVNTLAGNVAGVQADLANKQNKLTAGDNITISTDNIISASGGGLEVKTATTGNFNSAELLKTGLYYISGSQIPQNGPVDYAVAAMLVTMKYYSEDSNQRIQQTWIGCEDLVSNQIYTRYSKSNGVMNAWTRVDSNKIASASALGSIKVGDGLAISSDGTLSASGGTSSGDVSSSGDNTFTGINTFQKPIILDATGSTVPEIQVRYINDSGSLSTASLITPNNFPLGETYAALNIGVSKIRTSFSGKSFDMENRLTVNGAITISNTGTGQVNKLRLSALNGSATATTLYNGLQIYTDSDTYTSILRVGDNNIPTIIQGSTIKNSSGEDFITGSNFITFCQNNADTIKAALGLS